jgi:hypothetical protein
MSMQMFNLEAVFLQLLLVLASLFAVGNGQRHCRRQMPAEAVTHSPTAVHWRSQLSPLRL